MSIPRFTSGAMRAMREILNRVSAETKRLYVEDRVRQDVIRETGIDISKEFDASARDLRFRVLEPFSARFVRIFQDGQPTEKYRDRQTGRFVSGTNVDFERTVHRGKHLIRMVAEKQPTKNVEEIRHIAERITEIREDTDLTEIEKDVEIAREISPP